MFLAATVSLAALVPQGDGIIRLKPSDFRQLPAVVRRDLDRRGCRVPQVPDRTAPHNVISGAFIADGSRDWAVLCSVKGSSRVLVYRNGAASKVDSMARLSDSSFMQNVGKGVMQFSRKIDLAGPKSIADQVKAAGGPKPPPLNHDGIADGFIGKTSTIRYFSRSKWLELGGSD